MQFPSFSLARLIGTFVRIIGDTMTGNLLFNSPSIGIGIDNAPTGALPGSSTNWSDISTISIYGNTQPARIKVVGDNQGVNNTVERYSNDTLPGQFQGRKARGTFTAPTQVLSNDNLLYITAYGVDNSGTPTIRESCGIRMTAVSPFTATNSEGRIYFFVTPNSSVSPLEIGRLDYAAGFSMYGANPVIDQNRLHRLRGYTVGTLPSPTGLAGAEAYVTDASMTLVLGIGTIVVGAGANIVPVFCDGTNWRVG